MQERFFRADFEPRAFYITFFILRLALGGLFFEAGLTKLRSGTFSAAGLLSQSQGPFADFYTGLASNTNLLPVVNSLVMWGELLIGIALILGVLVRFASFWGIIQMILYYTVTLPPSSWVSQQVIYTVVFLTFMFSGIGYFIGLDRLVLRLEEKRHPLRLIFG